MIIKMIWQKKQLESAETIHAGFGILIRQRGFTLVELMIAVVIMTLMMLAFGMIVTEAQKVVTVTQNQTRGNNTADAIARVIRNDLSKITKNGFLSITQRTTAGSGARLFFVNAGILQSRVSTARGLGGISVYGLSSGTLFHQGWLLNSAGGGDDVWPMDLSTLQKLSRTEINQFIGNYTNSGPENNTLLYLSNNLSFQIPPLTLANTNNLWQILSPNTDRVCVMWTDGLDANPADGNVDWYGIDHSISTNITTIPKAAATLSNLPEWSSVSSEADSVKESFLTTNTEFQAYGVTGSGFNGPSYRALWTHHDQNNWPRAIKVRFQISDKEYMSASKDIATSGEWYEVIVPID